MNAVIEQDEVLEGEVITIGGFDYSGWDKNLAEECRLAADRIRRRMKRSSEDIIEIGQDLLRIKNKLDHGKWSSWIESEFGLTLRSANKFIAVAKKFGDMWEINSRLSFLQPTILYELITQDTTPEAIEEVLKKSEKKVLTLKEVKKIKQDARTALEDAETNWFVEKSKLQQSEKELKKQVRVLEVQKKALEKDIINPIELEKAQLEKEKQRATLLSKVDAAYDIIIGVMAIMKETRMDHDVIDELKKIQRSIDDGLQLYLSLLES